MQQVLLSGEFDHTLDEKGRLTLPARFREYFREGVMVVRMRNAFDTTSKEQCVRIYRQEDWEVFDSASLAPLNVFGNEEDNWTVREIYMSLDPVELDRQGRILLPSNRVQELGLSGKVKILGNRTHLEVWKPETLAAVKGEKEKKRGGQDA
jgi:MraZ protein